ncbi:MAG: hypothetical protein L6Q54_15665 [Leptospiraceae bacterium]|nr:hypothetical protein [Leptospiraceae bacterium]MCK6382673.1 hypothetical protein [Leptospiraceae bacterium]NUM42777.1 hypothetical protein [Leptospiraceae bacterium]
MKISSVPLKDYIQTVETVLRLAKDYTIDLIPFYGMTIFAFYNYVRRLPYISDPVGKETVSRPKYTLDINWTGARDCDDKTVPILAKAIILNIPSRAVVCGEMERPHHIYPEIKINGNWMVADATYPERCLFDKKLYNEKFRKEFYV